MSNNQFVCHEVCKQAIRMSFEDDTDSKPLQIYTLNIILLFVSFQYK